MKKLQLFIFIFSLLHFVGGNAASNEHKAVAYGSGIGQANFSNGSSVQRYGANLFSGGATNLRSIDPNPDYKLAPGDKVDIKTYGAVNFQQVSAIDAEGNIFLPDVGPVKLSGVTQSELNNVVTNKVGSIYNDNVKVYTNLVNTNNISVFVTGEVASPGRYLGDSRFSIIDYISQAGGIDNNRGSFRNIQVIRANKKLVDIDIYEFLKGGIMPEFTLREGDTILIGQRGDIVEVDGTSDNKFLFEFKKEQPISGAELIKYAAPKPDTTHVMISGTRELQPMRDHKTLVQFASFSLADGDKVTFVGGSFSDKIGIKISGMHKGANNMVVPADAKLSDVLDNIAVYPQLSDISSIYIRRKSVAVKQKQSIQDSLKKLQETILLAKTSGATQGSAITEGDAKVLDVLIQRAAEVQPEGRLVLSGGVDASALMFEDGDEIVIPQKTQVVTVSGEVLIPQAVIWDKKFNVKDYINKAGGFSDRANERQIVIVRANGETEIGYGVNIRPGDEVMILPEVKLNNLEVTGKVMEIIYKAAVAIAIPFRL